MEINHGAIIKYNYELCIEGVNKSNILSKIPVGCHSYTWYYDKIKLEAISRDLRLSVQTSEPSSGITRRSSLGRNVDIPPSLSHLAGSTCFVLPSSGNAQILEPRNACAEETASPHSWYIYRKMILTKLKILSRLIVTIDGVWSGE
jgi:hypothetical protein